MSTIWFSRGCPAHLVDAVVEGGWSAVGPSFDDRASAHVAIAGSEPYTAAELDASPELLAVVRTGIGTDAVDFDACTERGVMVTNTPNGPTISTAEHTIALMLAVAHQVGASAARLRRGDGESIQDYISQQSSMELSGRTLGLIGGGRIGSAAAKIAQALGMVVIVADPALSDGVPLGDLLAQSDVVSLHVPATPETTGMIDATAMASMKPGSILINCARGPIVVTDDLVDALKSGQLMGAGLDCTDPEPLPTSHPLLAMDNVIVTPHIASSTIAGRERMELMAFEQASMVLRGETPTELRNPAVLKPPRWSSP